MPVGRPKGSKNGDKGAAASKSRNATTKINPDAKPGKIRAAEDERTEFFCVCCGKTYKTQKGNFPKTRSPLFDANDGYLPYCKHCVDKYYTQLIDFFSGNEEKAIDRICQIADWYYMDEIWAATGKNSASTSRAVLYPSKMCMPNWKDRGTTYLDTISDRASMVLQSYEAFEGKYDQGSTEVTKAQIRRWGLGFEESEYRQLDEHYKSLSESIDTNDVVQDTLAKDLCEIKIQQIRARNKGDVDTFQKLTKLYQDTLKSANIKVRKAELDAANDDQACWGVFIRDIEQYTPADIYKDRSVFKDVDNIQSYFERFVTRPVKNFFGGTRVMDHEFQVTQGDDNDGA